MESLLKKVNKEKVAQYHTYLESLDLSEATIKRRLSSLRKFTEWAEKEGYLEKIATERAPVTKETPLPKAALFRNLHPTLFPFSYLQKAYITYHSISITRYLHYGILVVFCAALGFGLYQQLTGPKAKLAEAYPSALTTPKRYLSFQGRLTDSSDTPITSLTNFVFELYNTAGSGTPPIGGVQLWTSGNCSVDPDTDGIFSVLLGSDCGSEIAATVFSENAGVWVQITVGTSPSDEILSPRIRVATVGYALNAETLQGYPPGTGASMIPYIDSTGKITIAAASPTIESTSGTFAIKGQALSITTATGTNGNITIAPNGIGTLNINVGGTGPGSQVRITDANMVSGNLVSIYAGTNATGFDLLNLSSGSTEITRFSVDESGNTYVAGNLGVGTTNPNYKLDVQGGDFNVSGNLYTGGTQRLSSGGALSNITGYTQASGAFSFSGGGNFSVESAGFDVTTGGEVSGVTTLSMSNQLTNSYANTAAINLTGAGSGITFGSSGPYQIITGGSADLALMPGGNLGIGTTDPSQKLHIDGNMRLTGALYDYNNQAGTSGQILSTTVSGVDWVDISSVGVGGTGTINFLPKWISSSTLGNSLIYENGTNVGIGTTSPGQLLELYKLSGDPAMVFDIGGTDKFTLGVDDSVNDIFKIETGGSLTNTATPPFTIDSSGNVGIGTTAPGTYKLNVQGGNFNVSGNLFTGGTQRLSSAGALSNITTISMNNQLTNSYANSAAINLSGNTSGITFGGTGVNRIITGGTNSLALMPGGNVGIGTTVPAAKLDVTGTAWLRGTGTSGLYVDSSGNVGIGTTNPLAKLDVRGNLYQGWSNYSNIFYYTSSYYMGTESDTTNRILKIVNKDSDGSPSGDQGSIQFQTGSALATRMTIGLNGNVGIGTTGPGAKLDIVGDLKIGTVNSVSDNNQVLTVGSGIVKYIDTSSWDKNGADDYGAWWLAGDTGTAQNIGAGNTASIIGGVGIGTTASATDTLTVGVDESYGFNWTGNQSWAGTSTFNNLVDLNNILDLDANDASLYAANIAQTGNGGGLYVSNTGTGFSFRVDDETSDTSSFVVDQYGNVGIGLISPNAKLEVSTSGYGLGSLTGIKSKVVSTGSIGSAYGGYFEVVDQSIDTIDYGYGVYSKIYEDSGIIETGYGFYADCDDAATCYGLYVDAGDAQVTTDWGIYVTGEDKNYLSGNVGIGTTNPGAKLDIIGDLKIGTVNSVGDNNQVLTVDSGIVKYIDTSDWDKNSSDDYGAWWLAGDTGTAQNIGAGNTASIVGGVGIGTTASATDTLTINVDESYGFNWTGNQSWAGTSTFNNLVDINNILDLDANDASLYAANIAQTGNGGGLYVSNTGSGTSFRVDDASSDLSPFLIDAGGNVGIGTTAPNEKLEVSGNIRLPSSYSIRNEFGSYIKPGIHSVNGNTLTLQGGYGGTYIKALASDGFISFSSGGDTERVRIDNSGVKIGTGYVGVGTTAPANGLIVQGNVGIGTTNPGAKLDIVGDLKIGTVASVADNNQVLTVDSGIVKYIDTSDWDKNSSDDYGAWWLAGDTGTAQNIGAGNTALIVGGVGIGTTASNTDTLTVGVNQAYNFAWTGSQSWAGTSTFNNLVDINNILDLDANDASLYAANIAQTGNGGGLYVSNTGSGTSFRVDDETSDLSPFIIDASGNVGIGTTGPGAKLDVNGPAAGSGISLRSSDFVLTSNSSIFFDGSYSYTTGSYIGPYSNTSGTYDANTMKFSTSGVERMRINSSGNVGIGTTNPSKLLVVGSLNGTPTIRLTANTNDLGGTGANSNVEIELNADVTGSNYNFLSKIVGIGITGTGVRRGEMAFYTSNLGVYNSTPNLYLDYLGNVGIGTTAQDNLLSLNKSSGDPLLDFKIGDVTKFSLGVDDSDSDKFKIEASSTLGGATPALTIDSNSNVGIGTSGPGAKLDINGNLKIGTVASVADNNQVLTVDSGIVKYIDTSSWDKSSADDYGAWWLAGNSGTAQSIGAGNTASIVGGVGIGTTASNTDTLTIDVNQAYNFAWTGTHSYSAADLDFTNATSTILDTTGDLILDADGGDILFSDAGSYFGGWNAGNFGIGTTGPSQKLHIYDASSAVGLTLESGSSNANLRLKTPGRNWLLQAMSGGQDFQIYDETSGASRLFIDQGGNMGVGDTSPDQLLSIRKDSSGAVGPILNLRNYTNAGGSGGGIQFSIENSALTSWVTGAYIYGQELTGAGSTNRMKLYFGTRNASDVLATRMTIDEEGNVGIGTTGPSQLLELSKPTGDPAITFDIGGTDKFTLGVDDSVSDIFKIETGGSLTSTATPPFVITSGGNVGIGTTGPSDKLHIYDSGDNTDMLRLESGAQQVGVKFDISGYDDYILYNNWGVFLIRNVTDGRTDIEVRDTGNVLLAQSTGNVGIGTTNPGAKLDINGNLKIGTVASVADNNQVLTVDSGIVKYIDTSSWDKSSADDYGAWWLAGDSGTAQNIGAGNTASIVGGVGIGTTASATDILTVGVNQGYNFAWTGNQSWAGTSTFNNLVDINNILDLDVNDASLYAANIAQTGNGGGLYVSNTGSGTSFRVDDAVSDLSPFIIDNAGNVGIGTTTPASLLDVTGQVNLSGGTTGASPTPQIHFNNYFDNSGDPSVSHLELYDGYGFGISADDFDYFSQGWHKWHSGANYETMKLSSAGALTITSNFVAGGYVAVDDGSASAPTYIFINDPDTGLYHPAANTIGISIGGAEKIRINNAGNVGIGTTAPDNLLSLNKSSGDPLLDFRVGDVTKFSLGVDDSDSDKFKIEASSTLGGAMPALTIDSNSNVGIGTSGPGAKLDINGNLKIGTVASVSDNNQVLTVDSGIVKYIDTSSWDKSSADDYGAWWLAGDTGTAQNIGAGNTASIIGGVGIGTTASATDTLTVGVNQAYNFAWTGNQSWAGTSTFNGLIDINNILDLDANDASLYAANIAQTGNGGGLYVSNTGSGTSFRVDDETSDLSPFLIDNAGNVGIGTTGPGEKLEVFGKIKLDDETMETTAVTFDGDTSAGLKLTNPRGYITLTPLNTGWAHIYTDRTNFIFNKPVYSTANAFSSYDADLQLRRVGTTKITAGSSAVTIADTLTVSGSGNNYFVGNVGIGTTSPKNKLDIQGSVGIGTTYPNALPQSNMLHVSGNVGIGTTNPGAKLDINGDLKIGTVNSVSDNNQVLTVDSGIVKYIDTSSWDKSSADDYGAWWLAGDTGTAQSIGAGNTALIVGGVGIGTTASATDTLTVGVNQAYNFAWTGSQSWAGTSTFNNLVDINNILDLDANDASNYAANIAQTGNGGGLYVSNTGTGFSLRVDDQASDTSSFVIDQSGNVGIGTTGPDTKLHVSGSPISSFTGTTDGILRISGPYTANYFNSIDFAGQVSSENTPIARIAAQVTGSGTNLMFGTSNSYGSGITNTAMTIDREGNVGIGTTGPGELLHLYKSSGNVGLKLETDSSGYAIAYFDGSQTSDTTIGGFRIDNAGDSVAAIYGRRDGANNAAGLAFQTQASGGSISDRMWIDSTGNVGIGTTGPQKTLHLSNITTGEILRIQSSGDSTNTWLAIGAYDMTFRRETGTSSNFAIQTQIGSAGTGGNIVFSPNSDSVDYTPVERVRITKSGNVGIGTTSPAGQLTLVNSDGTKQLSINDGSYGDIILTGKTGSYGGDINITAGTSTNAGGEPGDVNITAGTGNNTDAGGNVTLTGGTSGAGSGSVGGNIYLYGGQPGGAGDGGNVYVGKQSYSGNTRGGSVYIYGQNSSGWGSGTGGDIILQSGTTAYSGLEGGYISLSAGQGNAAGGTGGYVSIITGAGGSSTGNSGDLTLGTGSVTSGSFGAIALKQGDNYRMYFDANGNIGIGNTAPTSGYKLDVNGNVNIGGSARIGSVPLVADNNQVLTVDSGIVKYIDTSSWDKSSADDYGAWWLAGDTGTAQNIGAGNTASIIGGVGIGTTASATDTLTVGVNQAYNFAWTGNQSWAQTATFNGSIDLNNILDLDANDASLYAVNIAQTGNGGGLFVSNTGTNLSFRVDDAASDTSPFAIDQYGNVGIGTTGPNHKLDVRGEVGFYNSGIDGTLGNAIFLGSPNYPTTYRNKIQSSVSQNAGAGKLIFSLAKAGDTTTDVLTLLNNGNVGIGTTGPVYTLDVNGSLRTTGDITLTGSSRTIAGSGDVILQPGEGYYGSLLLRGRITSGYAGDPSIYMQTYNAANVSTNRLYITSGEDTAKIIIENANVGIGTTGPGAKLDINGNLKIGTVASVADNNQVLTVDSGIVKYIDTSSWDKDTTDDGGSWILAGNTGTPQSIGAGNTASIVGGVGIGTTASATDTLTIDVDQSYGFNWTGTHSYSAADINFTNATSFTLDTTGDLILDADGGDILFSDAGSYFGGWKSGNFGIGTTGPSQLVELSKASGDPAITFDIGGTDKFTLGVDDSVSDIFKIETGGSLTSTATPPFVINSSGNIGIGTTGPVTTLHVVGKGSFGDSVTSSNATRALNLISSDAVMRILRVSANIDTAAPAVELIHRTTADGANTDYWDFFLDSSGFNIRDRYPAEATRLTINGSGYVGIGTTGPDNLLSLNKASGDPLLDFRIGDVTKYSLGVDDSDSDKFKIEASSTLGGATPALTIDSNSNVGIGTSGPGAKLDINGNLKIGTVASVADNNQVLTVDSGIVKYIDTSSWDKNTADDGGNWILAGNGGTPQNIGAGETASFLGGIGIGTTASATDILNIHVNQAYNFAWTGLQTWSQTATFNGSIDLNNILDLDANDASNYAANIAQTGNGGGLYVSNTGSGTSFRVDDETSDLSPFIIDASGNVGIGTTAPGYKVHIERSSADATLYVKNLRGSGGEETIQADTASTNTSGYLGGHESAPYTNLWYGVRGTTQGGVAVIGRVITSGEAARFLGGSVGIGSSSFSPGAHMLDVESIKGTTGNSAIRAQYLNSGIGGQEFGAIANREGQWNAIYAKQGSGGAALYTEGEVNMIGGNVGIGTTTPGYKLDVEGQIDASTYYSIGGLQALRLLASGNTTLVGQAGNASITGVGNNLIGSDAGVSLTSGTNNEFIGSSAGRNTQAENSNVAIGGAALYTAITGESNVVVGSNAGGYPSVGGTDPDYNTVIGEEAGFSLTGDGNIFLGYKAGYNETGSNKLYIENSNAGPNSALIYGDFSTNILAFNGNVGIGTTGPAQELHIYNASDNADLRLQGAGSASYMDVFSGGVSLGLWGSGAIPMIFATNGSEKMRITSDGNVGIGTSAPGAKLDIAGASSTISNTSGDITIDAASNNISFAGDNLINVGEITAAKLMDSASSSYYIDPAASGTSIYVNGDIALGMTSTNDDDYIYLDTGTNEYLEWDDDPGQFVLSDDFVPNADDTFNLGSSTARWADIYLGAGTIHLGSSTANEYTIGYDTPNNRLEFNVNGSGPAEFVVNSSGYIGIGTTNPSANLHIYGDLAVGILAERSSGNGSVIQFKNTVTSIYAGMSPSENFGIGPNANLNTSPWLHIDSASSNVGIGTTDPSQKLDVEGSIEVNGDINMNGYNGLNFLGTGQDTGIELGSGNHTDIYSRNDVRVIIDSINNSGDEFAVYSSSTATRVFAVDESGNVTLNLGTATAYFVCSTVSGTGSQILRDCSGSDYAEYFAAEASLEPGDLLSASPNNLPGASRPYRLAASSREYDSKLIGAVSTNGLVANEQIESTDILVALVGQIPLKASTINGPIEVGDPITSSEIPGVGMKATKAGPIIGKALESFNETQGEACPNNPEFRCGKILVFVNLGWNDPDVYLTDTGELNISQEGEQFVLKDSSSSLIERVGAFAEVAIAQLKAGLIQTKELVADNITTNSKLVSPVIETQEIETQRISLNEIDSKPGEDVIVNLTPDESQSEFGQLIVKGAEGTEVATIDAEGNASFSGELTASKSKFGQLLAEEITGESLEVSQDATIAGTLYAKKVVAEEIVGLESKFGELIASTVSATYITQNITNITQIVEPSPTPSPEVTPTPEQTITEAPSATDSGEFLSDQEIEDLVNQILGTSLEATPQANLSEVYGDSLTINEGLIVLGTASLADTTIAGSLNVGATMTLADNSLNTLTGPLYLQNLGLGGIDILAGKITIDEQGNAIFEGNVTVKGRLALNEIEPLPGQENLVVDLSPETEGESRFGKLLVRGVNDEIVASIDASGSAFFASLGLKADYSATELGAIIAAYDNYLENGYYSPAIETNATAGIGILPAGETEIQIYNPNVTEQSLIYLVPASDTKNKVLFVKAKHGYKAAVIDEFGQEVVPTEKGWFKAAIDTSITKEVRFNWWIVGGKAQ